jgi:hypothetical protein
MAPTRCATTHSSRASPTFAGTGAATLGVGWGAAFVLAPSGAIAPAGAAGAASDFAVDAVPSVGAGVHPPIAIITIPSSIAWSGFDRIEEQHTRTGRVRPRHCAVGYATMFAMRRGWIAAVGLFGLACFSPTDIEVASVSETGDTGSTDATMGDSMSDDDPSMSSANTMTGLTDPNTMTDPTSVDSSGTDTGTTDAPTTTDDPSTTGTTTDGGPMCMVDADCPSGTCTDGECVEDPLGDPYGACDECDADEVAVSIVDVEGCYCAPSCTMASDCPAPADGSATADCAVANGRPEPTLCARLCDPLAPDVCPVGSTCAAIPMQEGVGVCMYPV